MSRTNAARGERRVKYDAQSLDELGAEGKAFKGVDGQYSYPITDQDDLRKSVAAVSRGNSSHDEVRAFIIRRSEALKDAGLIPDNWASDGSLKETKGVWNSLEERESYGDLRGALESAINQKVAPSPEGYRAAWVQDFNDAWAVYEYKGDLLKVEYARDADGNITVGNPTKVRAVTNYLETNSDDVEIERRRKKAEAMSGKAMEHRAFDATMECREADDGSLTLTGYASVTDAPYEVGFYTETISRGAFKRTLRSEPDVTLLLNHEGLPLARTKGGTLTLEEDRHGLYVEAHLDPQDPDTMKLARKMQRGDLDGQMSFAFCAIEQDWSEDFSQRTLNAVEINRGDVSIVTQGANPATSSAMRGLDRDAVVGMLTEVRSGTVSDDAASILQQLLTAVGDEDAAPAVAKLIGDKGERAAEVECAAEVTEARVIGPSPLDGDDFTVRARQRLQALEMRKAR